MIISKSLRISWQFLLYSIKMEEAHLKENNPFLYNDLILDEKLLPYLKEIGEAANRRMEQMMEELLKKNPTPDKAAEQLAWV
ncbi:MAG: TnpV protein [Dorea sp.]|nr:TnpV protein [Dorea sp.]